MNNISEILLKIIFRKYVPVSNGQMSDSDVRFSAALSPTNMVREVELSKVRFFLS